MASTIFHVMAQVWLDVGKSWHLQWNNAAWGCVYAFNVQPHAAEVGTVMEAEVTRVWRKHIQHPTKQEAEVHVIVKNTGGSPGSCSVFMSAICG